MADPVEVIADLLARQHGYDNGLMVMPANRREVYRARAINLLAALDAVGVVVVPKQPSAIMSAAGADRIDGDMNRADRVYRAMVSAARVQVEATDWS